MKKPAFAGLLIATILVAGVGLRHLRGGIAGHATGVSNANVNTAEVTGVTDSWTSSDISDSYDPLVTGTGQIFGQAVTYAGTNPGNVRFNGKKLRYQEADNATHNNGETVNVVALDQAISNLGARGESGSFALSYSSSGTTSYTLTYGSTYYDPVIFLQIATDNGTSPVSVYATSVGESSATIELREPGGGSHSSETIDYLVVEAGTYTGSDGNVLVVSTDSITTAASGSSRFSNVALGATYTSYALLATIQSRSTNTGYGGTRIIKSSDYVQARFMRYPDNVADTGTIGFLTYGPGTALASATPIGCETCRTSCRPTMQYEYDPPQVLNALEGDLLFNNDPTGILSGLFSALGQTYSHVGIFTDDGFNVVHNAFDETAVAVSTKSHSQILLDSGFGNCKGDAWFDGTGLRNGLPGTCTMNPQETLCSYDGSDYTFTWDESTWALLSATTLNRGLAKLVANEVKSMDMYYRFFAFRNYGFTCGLPSSEVTDRSVTYTGTQAASSWDGALTETFNPGCMCAGTIAEASSLVGFPGEMNTVHTYTKAQVAAGAVALYQAVFDTALTDINKETNSWALEVNCKNEMADGIANQVLNCFAEDADCGSTSDLYSASAWDYYYDGGAGSFSLTAETISPDDLISNAEGSSTYSTSLSTPLPYSGGYMFLETGYGTCK